MKPPFRAKSETETLTFPYVADDYIFLCPHPDSNWGFSLERAASWSPRRWGRVPSDGILPPLQIKVKENWTNSPLSSKIACRNQEEVFGGLSWLTPNLQSNASNRITSVAYATAYSPGAPEHSSRMPVQPLNKALQLMHGLLP